MRCAKPVSVCCATLSIGYADTVRGLELHVTDKVSIAFRFHAVSPCPMQELTGTSILERITVLHSVPGVCG